MNDIQSILNISPSREDYVRAVADALRKEHGLWERLCRKSLWQLPTFEDEPVHNERTALCAILNRLGCAQQGRDSDADAFASAVGQERLRTFLKLGGIAEIDREAWVYWMSRAGEAVPRDQWPPWKEFSDGWHLRHQATESEPEAANIFPTEIPPTGEDEKVLWCYDDARERVYPLVY